MNKEEAEKLLIQALLDLESMKSTSNTDKEKEA